MNKTLKKTLHNKKAFTLVELLIVLAVLGIIAAIAIPRFMNIREGFVTATDKSTAQMWAKDIESAFVTGMLSDLVSDELLIKSDALSGYQGSVPTLPSDKTKRLIAKITYETKTKVYTLNIYPGDVTKTTLNTRIISEPIH